jgi:hypothetical protein
MNELKLIFRTGLDVSFTARNDHPTATYSTSAVSCRQICEVEQLWRDLFHVFHF